MNTSTFDFIWDNIVDPVIEQLYNKHSTFEDYNLQCYDMSVFKPLVRSEYESSKKELKKYFFNSGDNNDRRIDIHKIGSCYCKALLKIKYFTFDHTPNVPVSLLLINYALAYYVSIGLIYLSLIDYYLSSSKGVYVQKLIDHHTVFVPTTNSGHDSYNLGRIKTLALNDVHNIDFDVLTYSDMLYWIEKYNRDIIEGVVG